MDYKEQDTLIDMKAFIDWAIDHNYDFRNTMLHLGHDCYASLYPEHDHTLISAGYAKKLANL